MTTPNGPAGANPDVPYVLGKSAATGIGGLVHRTQGNIQGQLNAQHFPTSTFSNFTGKTVKPAVVPGLDASSITTGYISDGVVPSVGALRDAICQGVNGGTVMGHTPAQVKTAIASLITRLNALES